MATQTETLIVELDAKVGDYNKKMDEAESTNKSVGSSMVGVGKSAFAMGAKIAAAAAAAAAAITTMVVSSANQRKELEILAKQTKLTVNEFQQMSFITKQAGINGEQFADISKDIADRLGEFAAAGTGTFQDFADVTGLSKKEARALAVEWQNLSGDQVLGEMVKRMEEAGATGNEMTFVMESMGNDASRLTDLFKDNGKELRAQKIRFAELTKGMQLTNQQGEALKEVAGNFTTLTTQAGLATDKISATLAPVISDFFNDVINIVPAATQTIVNFINTFQDAADIKSVEDINEQLKILQPELERTRVSFEAINKAREMGLEISNRGVIDQADDHNEALQRQKELQEQLLILKEQNAVADAQQLEGGEIGGGVSGGSGESGADDITQRETIEKRLENFANSKKAEIVLIEERFALELELLQGHTDSIILLENEKFEAIEGLEKDAQKRIEKNAKEKAKIAGKEISDAKKGDIEKLNSQQTQIRGGMALNNLLFNDNKAVAAGLIVADTATGIQKSLSINPYDYANVAIIAATGAANLASALGASKGGGSISSGSTGAGSSTNPTQQGFEPETTSLEVTEQGEEGVRTVRHIFENADGEVFFDSVASSIEESRRQGR